MSAHEQLKLIIKHGAPYGIRDESGYLFFFAEVQKYTDQDERYRAELVEQFKLADYLLLALDNREAVTAEAE